jgi:hypothetical protein
MFKADKIRIQTHVFSPAEIFLPGGITCKIFRTLQAIKYLRYLFFLFFVHKLRLWQNYYITNNGENANDAS